MRMNVAVIIIPIAKNFRVFRGSTSDLENLARAKIMYVRMASAKIVSTKFTSTHVHIDATSCDQR